MSLYSFTIVVEGDELGDGAVDAIYGGGLDDATIREFGGWQLVEVDREAVFYGQALFSALRQLEEAVSGVTVVRVVPEGLLALQDIADSTGRSRESVRLLIAGERGPGGFPPPVVQDVGRSRLWSATDVAYWFAEHFGEARLLDEITREMISLNTALNARLDLRRVTGDLDDETRRALADLVPLEDAS
ncbi:MAG: hypothetical protein ACRDUY_03600 [Nitriliruptorales bacterium]